MKRSQFAAARGDTLIELIVAVSILGIAFVALISGMFTTTISSDTHRKQATARAALSSFAEAVKRETYVACASTASYGSTYTAPANFTKSVTTVEYSAASASNPAVSVFQGACPSTDEGVQRLTLQMASSDGRVTEKLVMVKRCTGARPSPCP
jgi:prepilin-type N-terminal cleavage/methylation domain-containing protein